MIKKLYDSIKLYAYALLKWLILAPIVGIVCGLVGASFSIALGWAANTFNSHTWFVYFLPLAGLVIVFLYKSAKMVSPTGSYVGTNEVFKAYRDYGIIKLVLTPLIFVATLLTHLFGGSAGREGAALQMGGSLGSSIARILKLSKRSARVMVMCGMSAVFTALFGTPLAATIFSIEVINVGSMYYYAFLPALVSSYVALWIAQYFGCTGFAGAKVVMPEFGLASCGKVFLLALLCSFVAMIFCFALHYSSAMFKKLFKNSYIRVFAGGVLVIILTLIFGNEFNGAGSAAIANALNGQSTWSEWILKIVFTVCTLSTGFKGGEIVPSFFVGSTFANSFAPLLGINPQLGGAIGLVTVFCAVTNAPIASLVLAFELFGAEAGVLFTLAVATGYAFSGYTGLYDGQRIVYSKLDAKYVDVHVNKEVGESKRVEREEEDGEEPEKFMK